MNPGCVCSLGLAPKCNLYSLPGPWGSRKNKFTFWRERRVGGCKAPRRRRCGSSSRRGNAADARPPPRPEGRPAPINAICCDVYLLNDAHRSRSQNVKLFLREPLVRMDPPEQRIAPFFFGTFSAAQFGQVAVHDLKDVLHQPVLFCSPVG
jgi:hypothetical protein